MEYFDDDIVTGSNTKIETPKTTSRKVEKVEEVEFDLNKDGKFDKKDVSIAGKTLVKAVKKKLGMKK